jgi:hypothetical protein
MSRKTIHSCSVLMALALLAWLPGAEAIAQQPAVQEVAQQSAKWFVLRQGKTGYCQTALLISIGGDYRNRSSLKAGGPYSTQEEALRQKEALEAENICTKG